MQLAKEVIPLSECVKGGVYLINSRNLDIGVFNGETGFVGIREKFGQHYLFTEYHRDTGAPYGTVSPYRKIGDVPEGMVLADTMPSSRGTGWMSVAVNPASGAEEEVFRRDLRADEPPHGSRHGFVDEWKDGTRLPDKVYPWIKGNNQLFKYLEKLHESLNEEKI